MTDLAKEFHRLHLEGEPLRLANAWDAASAKLVEAAGGKAVATTSAGLAWSRGYPDGDRLPRRELASAVEGIARVLRVPLTVDVEGGYASDAAGVAETIAAVVGAGGVGINIEDGQGSPDVLCAKITAAKSAARRAGVDLFVNARTDVYLRGLVPPERAVAETLERARRYRDAGCDGLFVPLLAEPGAIREIVAGAGRPLNLMLLPKLPPAGELAALGVRRLSAGAAIASMAYASARRAAKQFLDDGRYDAMFEAGVAYGEMNELLSV